MRTRHELREALLNTSSVDDVKVLLEEALEIIKMQDAAIAIYVRKQEQVEVKLAQINEIMRKNVLN